MCGMDGAWRSGLLFTETEEAPLIRVVLDKTLFLSIYPSTMGIFKGQGKEFRICFSVLLLCGRIQ